MFSTLLSAGRTCALVVMLTLLNVPGAQAQLNPAQVGQSQVDPAQTSGPDRTATGGAQTLEDIMARQRGERIDDRFRRDATGSQAGAAPGSDQLGTLGGVSDPEFLRAMRYNEADLTSAVKRASGNAVMQDGGMRWLELRRGPLPRYGGYMMGGMAVLLVLFYLLRGQIRIEGEKTGQTILRFKLLERIAHWSMAIPFIFLGITGLIMLLGRMYLIPLIGKPAFSTIATGGKFVHNYIAWVFMFGLILSFLLWAWKNLPDRYDIPWLLKGGGMFTKGSHPSAGKFNAGEKIIFWVVIGLGTLISLTGLALLFPFEIQIISDVNGFANTIGLPQMLGFTQLQTVLTPQEEMQLAQLWHAGIAFVFMTIIIAHIYLGSVGMEGALDSMTKGTVDVQWAKEHHDKWYEEVSGAPGSQPEGSSKDAARS